MQISPIMIAWGAPSFQELIVILIIVLIVFGAKRLPELARALGKSMNEFRKAKDEFEDEIQKSANSATAAPTSLPQHSVEASNTLLPQSPSQTVPATNSSSLEKTPSLEKTIPFSENRTI